MSRADYEPYLARRTWTKSELKSIGFFNDGLKERELTEVVNDRRWTTPTYHLKKRGVVLCTTGAFSPFHAGHLRMLEIARKEVEAKGWEVAGAYVCPDHDGYVSKKHGGIAACPASERIYQAQLFLKDHPWIQVDPWAALYQDRPLNYTTILAHTTNLLNCLNRYGNYEVMYVFGSDNAGFKDAFRTEGEYVCVGRPGAGEAHPDAIDISSTQVRGCSTVYPKPSENCPYLLRDDLDWATQRWRVGMTIEPNRRFFKSLCSALLIATGQPPCRLSAEVQRLYASILKIPHISFDRVTSNGQHWISRLFDLGLQEKASSYLSSDLSKIPAGEYALMDDDIGSGSTIEEIKRRTPQVKWVKEISLAEWIGDEPYFDIVDARDFLFGARDAGLFIRDGDSHYRAPYISPWVNLMTRAKIEPSAQPAFVQSVIRANIEFFGSVPVAVRDAHNSFFWNRLGFDDEMSMLEVSKILLTWNPN